MVISAWSATGSKEVMIGKSSTNTDLTASLDAGNSRSDGDAAVEEGAVEPESWWYYHLMLVVCAFYVAMFLTDWSTQPVDTPLGSYNVSLMSFWVKVGSQWACLLMYAWTLLAPYLLRNHRDFGIEFDF